MRSGGVDSAGIDGGVVSTIVAVFGGAALSAITSTCGRDGRIGVSSSPPNGIPARTAHKTTINPIMIAGTQIHDFEFCGRAAGGTAGAGFTAGGWVATGFVTTGFVTTGFAATGFAAVGGGTTGMAATDLPHFEQNCASAGTLLPQLPQKRFSTTFQIAETMPILTKSGIEKPAVPALQIDLSRQRIHPPSTE
jgi:hypothetical protein